METSNPGTKQSSAVLSNNLINLHNNNELIMNLQGWLARCSCNTHLDPCSRMIVQPTRANVHPIQSVMKRAKSRRRSVAARWQLLVAWSATPYGGNNNRSNPVNQGLRELLCRKCNIEVIITLPGTGLSLQYI